VLCHVSVSNSNAFSLFLKVLRDMSVGCRSCGRVFENDGTINRETTSSVSCPRAWHCENMYTLSYFPQKQGFFCIGSPKSHVDDAVVEDSSRPSPSFIKCRPLYTAQHDSLTPTAQHFVLQFLYYIYYEFSHTY